MVLNCLLVRDASSSAIIKPKIVTIKADVFRAKGIDIIGVFDGTMLDVMTKPAMMLPHASRLIGLVREGLFSLIGENELKRGNDIVTKKITRKLYTAVKEVAIRVKVRAQAFRWDVFMASIIESFEKNPAKKGVPVKARLPIVRAVEVRGVR